MDKEEYKQLVAKKKPKESRCLNAFIAFVVGGSLAVVSEFLSFIYMKSFGLSKVMSLSVVCLTMIATASILTGFGFFDDWVKKGKCGLIVPTTGFAHSVTSAALEYKTDGLITGLGSNFFKLAGSVILFGIISAFFLCLLMAVCNG
ncbi:MAG: SpoVA/SpoVAEb family sporulation membrane protein [Bacilli bacterium]|nr:SpoVA/SpoVAEb family sporulation membrane protein [Bacilli bacterium]